MKNPSEILALFFAIKPETIAQDLKQAEDRLPRVAERLAKLTDVDSEQRTAAHRAEIAHVMMVQAHELCRASHVLPEFKVFYASFGAGNVVQMAESVAMDQGRLAELGRQMDDIRRREGLAADEHWLRQRGPADHRALEAEADDIGTNVADTVLTSVLRRYRLNEQANLYEHDRRQWDFLREVGSRVISGDEDGSAEAEVFTDQYFRKQYGDEFVRDIHSRVDLIRQAVRHVQRS